jgi:hypothetical protein
MHRALVEDKPSGTRLDGNRERRSVRPSFPAFVSRSFAGPMSRLTTRSVATVNAASGRIHQLLSITAFRSFDPEKTNFGQYSVLPIPQLDKVAPHRGAFRNLVVCPPPGIRAVFQQI